MRLIMTHGYMLSDTGSNVYVQNLCRGLVREGHDVHLLCQEPEPLSYDFVNECSAVDREAIEQQGEQETPYPGRCAVYRPGIGGLLPVYSGYLKLPEEERRRCGEIARRNSVEHLGWATLADRLVELAG